MEEDIKFLKNYLDEIEEWMNENKYSYENSIIHKTYEIDLTSLLNNEYFQRLYHDYNEVKFQMDPEYEEKFQKIKNFLETNKDKLGKVFK